ncbi:LuxR C-terminal-related transcriptional regulator [Chitinophaga sancti]|uniref:LuxR C-terminal-related transcriptional regulator n=1 Tax=Chitinophaga sancti TaxID=1004 RepID=A0A1K1PM14_9BACT|nr:LuxR C-terminal-related transcriptional regulator [Chitinophaga sancti]WQD59514.1 LuxR C-terminal-related transcriptional regulator [Chitinophaga sancti]WQG88351.1 LuxR C-terminal-related transcriptional regulator [Chitinophaga sancti]SFW48529.1 PAS fold-containing protein [Chitinophaga sancti]
MSNPGEFSRSMITALPADLNSEQAISLRRTIQRFPEEAIYVYSFKENRMVYADGWEEVLGYDDSEINMLSIVDITTPEYKPFSFELNDKALMFIMSRTEELEKYSFTIELKKLHKNGVAVPLIVRVGVFRSENGRVTEIIGRNQVSHRLRLGKVMQYAAYGPEKAEFEEELNKNLFHYYAISQKEKEALAMLAQGRSFKEIAHELNVTQSAIEKRIIPLYKRFEVKSLTHLVTFAYENHILP